MTSAKTLFDGLKQRFRKIPKLQTDFGLNPSPVTIYYLILIPTLFLMVTGYFMVFSAKTIQELGQGDNPYTAHLRTTVIMLVGVVAMMITSRIPNKWLKILSIPIFLASLALQSLIFPYGQTINGNRNWVFIPGLPPFQPSEALKVGLTLMLAFSFAVFLRNRREWHLVGLALGVPFAVAVVLVMAGSDLGTTMVLVGLALGIVSVGRLTKHQMLLIGGSVLLGAFAAVLAKPSRVQRVLAWFSSDTTKDASAPDQLDFSLRALGSGGFSGVGAGASKEKWFSLPAADTDFIFAVLGEEFGFLGTFSVLLVFFTLFFGMYRLALLQMDVYKRLVVTGTLSWMGAQTFVNLGTVTGWGPIVGVPLPFISHGGSSFIITAICIGVILGIARETAGFKGKNGVGQVFRRRLG